MMVADELLKSEKLRDEVENAGERQIQTDTKRDTDRDIENKKRCSLTAESNLTR